MWLTQSPWCYFRDDVDSRGVDIRGSPRHTGRGSGVIQSRMYSSFNFGLSFLRPGCEHHAAASQRGFGSERRVDRRVMAGPALGLGFRPAVVRLEEEAR
ncbi:hypothetical protein GW17_00026700 [Ensete ventricosum]|nr:hypothetical protein GW17_00026700 [Ensete ventricosum]